VIRGLVRRLATRALDWPREDEATLLGGAGRVLRVGEPFRVLSWNVQFAASREPHFFYDGGNAVGVTRETVERTLERLATELLEADADVVLLQEVDRRSRRTAFIDQHAELLRRVAYPMHAAAPYWRVRYVPFPSHERIGRVHMDLSAFSRLKILEARRFPLARLAEPAWRRAFNLRRGVLEIDVATEIGAMRIFDVHLSAFSRGDGTLDRQVGELLQRLVETDAARIPWIMAGDLNALPPGDDASRLRDAFEYPEATSPIAPLLDRWRCPIPPGRLLDPAFRTYLPPGAADADRILDWVLVSEGIAVEGFQVRKPPGDPSDHRPLQLDARLML
jgi:endonuclease/exonuclease/phosphatase family metal-dependent hydrolase